ncbi:MAG: sugar phosphate isomerase/epimerase [Bacteroidetes bacterium]|nr:sugar phosphate isomerase/epimerase [Bacteroidota bacterium]
MKNFFFGWLCFAIIAFSSCGGSSDTAAKTDSTTKSSDSTNGVASVNPATDWKLGVQLWTFHVAGPFVKSITQADSAGIKYVEAFPGQPLGGGMKDTFGIRMSADSRAKIKQLLQSKGIQIVAMGVITPKTMDEWKQYFDLAKEFGLSYITCEPLKNQWDGIDSLAGVYGINIAIHDHPRPNAYWHPDSVLAAVKGHPHIGSCADVGHWTRNGLDPVECLKKLEGHVYGVHLKDIDSAGNTKAKDLVVGTGVIKFTPIFQELKRQGFKGMLSIEREDNWDKNVQDVIATRNFYNEQLSKL